MQGSRSDTNKTETGVQHNIKRTAIPASGYLYQTLVGIRLLCDWLSNPVWTMSWRSGPMDC